MTRTYAGRLVSTHPEFLGQVKGSHGTALNIASYAGRFHIVKILIDAGADINLTGGDYHTALQAASDCRGPEKDYMNIVRLLLKNGAAVNLAGGVYHTALNLAVYNESSDLISLLIEAGADPNVAGGDWFTSLRTAMGYSNMNIARLSLKSGAEVNASYQIHGTALHEAVVVPRLDLIELLLGAGANIDATDGHMGTPLHIEIYNNHWLVLLYLLHRGADINCRAGVVNDRNKNPPCLYYCSPLGYAVSGTSSQGLMFLLKRQWSIEIVKVLRRYGADVTDLNPRELKNLKDLGFGVERIDGRLTITGEPSTKVGSVLYKMTNAEWKKVIHNQAR